MSDNEKLVNEIKSTMAVEGLYLDTQDVDLIQQFLNHEITEQEGIDKIKNDILSRME